MTPQQFAQAIGQIESGDHTNAPLGDEGRAFGRFQTHIDWLWQWANSLHISPALGETLDSFQNRVVQAYFTKRIEQGLTPVEAAVSYHRGHICREGDADWAADDYAQRFDAAVI